MGKNKYTVLSMFSGCGGMDKGFIDAGYEVLWANDLNKDACDTYRKNIGHIEEGDVCDVAVPLINDLDVLTAGFPCQPFSNAGSRKGTDDDRGNLYHQCLRFIRTLNPKVILFENVRGFLSFKNGDELLIETVCRELSELGYEVQFKLVKTSDYGVPQHRIRLIIVGTLQNVRLGHFSFPQLVKDVDLTLGATILDIPADAPNQSELMQLNPQAVLLGTFVPEGGSWKNIPTEHLPDRLKLIRDNMEKYRWPNFYRRFHRNEVAGTITAAFKPENAGVWHPVESRVFSVREIARIQTFPDDFIFYGANVKSRYAMIGNAVPPRLAQVLGEEIKVVLQGKTRKNRIVPVNSSSFDIAKKPVRPSDLPIFYDGPAVLATLA
ncbi:DNA cytosine methyltransferase [Hymenobacter siberiensis]|uniref:DNA cytosine methyltransferase n=1 Tax=Hymenobacter siberiensis TaxID=2848396 RepID=UPI001C1E6EFD|nr:DNA cytosine methyltransferase [Hymenobacter siberiensis]MBU6122275.1 DNA cytosine methyltransferase [Hymenobacter siberiensis]